MTHTYIVSSYDRGVRKIQEVEATSADDAIDIIANRARGRHARQYASYTRRWQNSPFEADRDNAHAQSDYEGLTGWAARRKEVIDAEAQARNQVARDAGCALASAGYAVVENPGRLLYRRRGLGLLSERP